MLDFSLSVSQLNEYVRKSLSGDPMLQHICITGELTGFKRQASGHWYFALKDENAVVNCVMFRQNSTAVAISPENGNQVRVFGSVGLYSKTGSYQFYADAMEMAGLGELFLRFEAMKRRLGAQGLFDAASKKPLPLLPSGIGIVTSSTGAVIHDIARVTWRRYPGMPLYLYPVKVQGEGAAEEIAHAIDFMDTLPQVDVLIVGRGGGSMEDLWAFNEECVARSIFRCKKPVISAVGHETDYTIADFTADVRAATPSAAAEIAVPVKESLLAEVEDLRKAMNRQAFHRLEKACQKLALLQERIRSASPKAKREQLLLKLSSLENRISSAEAKYLMALRFRLDEASLRVRSSGASAALDRGFAVVTKNGKGVRRASQVRMKDEIRIHFQDGIATALITDVQLNGGRDSDGREEEKPEL